MKERCPNYNTCQLIIQDNILESEELKTFYKDGYCISDSENWYQCNRFIIKNKMNFCPDFVLPNSNMSVDAVMDKFDELN